MRYTVLRVAPEGVVLYREHAERLAPEGGPARAAFETFARSAAPGVYAVRVGASGALEAAPRAGSALADGMASRRVTSPVAHLRGAFPKPAPPGPYAAVRAPGLATLLTSPDGTEIYEACVAAVIGYEAGRIVLPPADRPRVGSVSERAIVAALSPSRAPLPAGGRMPLLLVNAVKGTCRLDLADRDPFPAEVAAELERLWRASAMRP